MVDFTASVTGDLPRLAPTTFEFTGGVTPAVTGYSWNFGDGTTSNEAAPSHHWTTAGAKDVTLTVIRTGGGQESTTKVAFVTVTPDALDTYRDLLITKFKTRVTFRGFLTPHLEQEALLDHVSTALAAVRSLLGTGVQFDTLGEILGLPRLGRLDPAYRLALANMPTIGRGYGQLEVLIGYTQLFLTPDSLLVFDGGMHVLLDAVMTTPVNYTLFLQRVQQFAAAGVKVDLVVSDDGDVPLEFEYTDESPTFLTDNELSELDYEENGFLAELI
jgi:PKD repeat protein